MDARTWALLVVAVLGCEAVGLIGSLATASSVQTWYPTLEKPGFTPPGWFIGATWTLLYAVMGVAVWRIWRYPSSHERSWALGLFGLQLALNAVWTPVFFGLRMPGLALVVILALVAALAATLWSFFRVDRAAGWLLVPYLAWASFATILNASIWWLNL